MNCEDVVLVDLRVVPLGVGTSVGDYVAAAVRSLEEAGFNIVPGSMSSQLELCGLQELARALEVVVNGMREMGVPRILIDVRLDARFDRGQTLEGKLSRIRVSNSNPGSRRGRDRTPERPARKS